MCGKLLCQTALCSHVWAEYMHITGMYVFTFDCEAFAWRAAVIDAGVLSLCSSPDSMATCWYILLSGSVFVKEHMYLARCWYVRIAHTHAHRASWWGEAWQEVVQSEMKCFYLWGWRRVTVFDTWMRHNLREIRLILLISFQHVTFTSITSQIWCHVLTSYTFQQHTVKWMFTPCMMHLRTPRLCVNICVQQTMKFSPLRNWSH